MNLKAFIALAMIATSLPLLGQVDNIPEAKGISQTEKTIYTILKIEPGPSILLEKKYPEKQKGVTTYKRENYSIDFTEYTKKIDPDEAVKYVKSLLADNRYKVNDRIITLSNGKDLEQVFISWAAKKEKTLVEAELKKSSDHELAESSGNPDNSPYRMSFDFAGLVPGCKKDEALKVMANSGKTKLISDKVEYGRNYCTFSGNNQLKNVDETQLTFSRGRLEDIYIKFKITNESNINEFKNALKTNIEKKFGPMQFYTARRQMYNSRITSEGKNIDTPYTATEEWYSIKDNQKEIKLNSFMGLTVRYTNLTLENGTPETIKEKATKFGSF